MSKTYAQLQREIAALQRTADRQLAIESKGAVSTINEMIAKFKLTAAHLRFGSATGSAPAAKRAGGAKAKAAASAKSARYEDGKGNQWGGRGPRPAWLRSALAAGHALESFLLGAKPTLVPKSGPTEAKPAPAAQVTSNKVPAKSGAVKAARAKKAAPAKKLLAEKIAMAPVAEPASATRTTMAAASDKSGLTKASARKPATKSAAGKKTAKRDAAAKRAAATKNVVSRLQ